MLNKFFGKKASGASESDMGALEWSVDEFRMSGDVVGVKGWSYLSSEPDIPRRIAFYDANGRRITDILIKPAFRPDIILHAQSIEAGSAGFDVHAEVIAPEDVFLFLEIETSQGVEQIPIGMVASNAPGSKYFLIQELHPNEVEALEKEVEVDVEDAHVNAGDMCARGIDETLIGALSSASNVVLVFTHSLGGGAEYYLQKRIAETSDKSIVVVRYDADLAAFSCEIGAGDNSAGDDIAAFPIKDIESLVELLPNISEIWINELVGYPNIASLLPYILRVACDRDAKLEFMAHDYYALCQSYNLVSHDGKYCGLPQHDECLRCFELIRSDAFAHAGISEYRNVWETFLLVCDRITTFSESSRKLFERAYPLLAKADNIRVIPHEVAPLRKVNRKRDLAHPLKIATVGVLSHNKGLPVVLGLTRTLDQNDANVELIVIGSATEDYPSVTRRQTGRFEREELPGIIEREKVDAVLIPSIWPETFSFTTQEVIDMGLPLAVFDIGAPSDRVREYEKGLVLPLESTPEQIIEAIRELVDRVG